MKQLTRRDLFKFMIAAGVAEATVDWEKLLWTPKPIITVPAMPPPPEMMNQLIYHGPQFDQYLTNVAHKFARDRGYTVFPDLRSPGSGPAGRHVRTTLTTLNPKS